ncbi:hypothetical protein A9P98_17105 [Cylindrospermopsis raciborskii CS-505]|uniref:Uncharacterized protein n=1 Tax=Cylindrospermopsis raciborskii CS-505 TaxID=533240 RepID=A0A853MFS0_9CYAN|nr:hypothetical protein A9P98_17105 [Cylindrospermopsis raciborskii CS-505]
MGTQIPMMKIYHCQAVNPPMENFWRLIHIRVNGIFEEGLKNAIAFMNGVVDPNIKYWWLKKDLIWANRFP